MDELDGVSITLLYLEGEGIPIVHGQLVQGGEFASLSVNQGRFIAARDGAGTRPVWVRNDGRVVASDHRFLVNESFTLLGAGTEMALGGRSRRLVLPGELVPDDFEGAAVRLASLIDSSVKRRVEGHAKVAVSFSGGLDSSIVVKCASRYAEVVACSVHCAGSADAVGAAGSAEALDVALVERKLDRDSLASELRSLDLPFDASAMDRALWCIYSVSSRMAREAGAEAIMLGQLADELFGGYKKYQVALSESGSLAAERLMAADVKGCGERGFVRDEIACSRSLEPRFPFSDDRILSFGLACPTFFKLKGGERKAILRKAAKILGVPEDICTAPKKAAQYSSGVLKLLA
ncbi:MAG TPA: asparagine synthase-related protein [Nitrososphaerales archaeon]|nr:asparagine synthase-related protein [Nitrososphaerales archaeon]